MPRAAPRPDPFDAALLVCAGAVAVFGLLVAAVSWSPGLQRSFVLWPVFALASLIGWASIERWAPPSPTSWRHVAGLAAFVVVETLTVAPLVVVALDAVGPAAIMAGVLVTGASFAGLILWALAKPERELELRDPLVVLAIMALALGLLPAGLGLPGRLVMSAPLLAITGLFILDEIANVLSYTRPGEAWAGGARLFAWVSVLFAEVVFRVTALSVDGVWERVLSMLDGAMR